MLFDDIKFTPDIISQHSWQGMFADSPVGLTSLVHVIIPDFDENLKIGPCRWSPRVTGLGGAAASVLLPVQGNLCLIIFDNDREPWVVEWWPY